MFYAALIVASLALQSSAAPTTTSSKYSLVADYSGSSFFNGFTAYTGADPTNGNVDYRSMKYGAEHGLLGFVNNNSTNSLNAYIGVDYKNKMPNRDSMRLSSKQTFDAGTITVMDVVHAPVAFGTWPALWMLGDVPGAEWPSAGGEIDILEWVHETPFNAMTLHTGSGCSVQNSTSAFHGQLQHTNCNAGQGSDGCSIQAPKHLATKTGTLATAGKGFNDQGGAVFVVDWTAQGVSMYMFARHNVPADIVAGKPDPASWNAVPVAKFSGAGCDYTTSLSDAVIIADTTFCGQWAGDVWTSSGAAAATGVKTCAEYVENNPAAFSEAYFEIRSIRVFADGGRKPGVATKAKRDVNELQSFPMISVGDRHNCTDAAEGLRSGMATGSYNATVIGLRESRRAHGHRSAHHHGTLTLSNHTTP